MKKPEFTKIRFRSFYLHHRVHLFFDQHTPDTTKHLPTWRLRKVVFPNHPGLSTRALASLGLTTKDKELYCGCLWIASMLIDQKAGAIAAAMVGYASFHKLEPGEITLLQDWHTRLDVRDRKRGTLVPHAAPNVRPKRKAR